MGKTTLLFHLLERFRSSARTAFLFQTQCNSREFMRFLLTELGCGSGNGQDPVAMHDEFNRLLLQEARTGRRCILIVDEAQNLDPSVLETIRLLSDFETPRAKLLQIVLAGQPELADKLARPSLAQLRQRISLIGRLNSLPPQEVKKYMDHRLRVAGVSAGPVFSEDACAAIAGLSLGIPRNINNICFNALSLAFALREKTVTAELVQEVAADFDLSKLVTQVPPAAHPAELAAEASFRQSNQWPDLQLGRKPNSNGRGRPELVMPDAKHDDALTLLEAKAYMQRIIELLRERPEVENQSDQHVASN